MATSSASYSNAITVAKGVLSAAASFTATAMLVHSMAQNIIPHELQNFLFSGVRGFLSRFSNELTVVIEEYDGLVRNELFEAAQIFLATKQSPSTQRIRVIKPQKENNFTVAMERNESVVDSFRGVEIKWFLASRRVESGYAVHHGMNSTMLYEVQYFELAFHKKHKETVLEGYLPFIVCEAKSLKQGKKTLKLFTPSHERVYGGPLSQAWTPVNLDHPATFETLAMDSELKEMILADLERFVRRKEYYRRVGKAWKRGYLLYGPPGTGKSSLVAAMANYLNFDVYDLELSGIRGNSELRRLLVGTANQSILVVEDIDCTIELEDRKAKARMARAPHMMSSGFPQEELTLSGLLNFIDGLWSSCGDERIIIFTTNHKEKLDPALLRPGRMDLHIHMSYCTPRGFKLLTSNYLKIDHHRLFDQIENLIMKAQVTPAEVAEELMKNDDPEIALQDMIAFLEVKEKENREANEKAKSKLELEEKTTDQKDLGKEEEEEDE